MSLPGSSNVTVVTVAVAVLGLVSMLQICMAQGPDEFSLYNSYYGDDEPIYQSSVRHPRSILQNFAVDRMLKDNGFVRSIINCVLDKGPCESNGRKLRLMAPEILRGQCPGCSRTVHNQIRRVISHVQRNFPVEWSEVTRRFMSYNNPSASQEFSPPPQPPQHIPSQHMPPPQHPQHLPPQHPQHLPSQHIPPQHPQHLPPQHPQHLPPQPVPDYNQDPNMYQNVYG